MTSFIGRYLLQSYCTGFHYHIDVLKSRWQEEWAMLLKCLLHLRGPKVYEVCYWWSSVNTVVTGHKSDMALSWEPPVSTARLWITWTVHNPSYSHEQQAWLSHPVYNTYLCFSTFQKTPPGLFSLFTGLFLLETLQNQIQFLIINI